MRFRDTAMQENPMRYLTNRQNCGTINLILNLIFNLLKGRDSMEEKTTGYQTKQKARILSYFETHPDRHFTAAEIVQAMVADGAPIGAATVYRQLDRLEQSGLLRRYITDDRSSACWQYGGEAAKAGTCHAHFHLKCTACGVLIHLDCDHLAEITAHLQNDHGFTVAPERTTFYGICEQCSTKAVSR